MRNFLIVWNPVAGGSGKSVLAVLEEELKSRAHHYTIADTLETRSAEQTVREQLSTDHTDLIIIGGDGTLNEAINGLKHDVPVAIIPAGTGNDFVKMLNLGPTVKEQIRTALDAPIVEIDLGICNDRKFVNGVGIGFDGQIVEDMASKRVPLLTGHLAYYYHVLRILGGYKAKRFQFRAGAGAKDFSKELILLTIGNGSTFGGGFKLMPSANLTDGLLEVCEIGNLSGLQRFMNIHRLSGGTHDRLKEVNLYQVESIEIGENPLLFAHIDGERLGQPPFSIRVLPKHLKIRSNQ